MSDLTLVSFYVPSMPSWVASMLQDPSKRLERPEISLDEFSGANMAPGSVTRWIFSKRLFQATMVLKNAKHQIGHKVNKTLFQRIGFLWKNNQKTYQILVEM